MEEKLTLLQKLSIIQSKLVAPKNQYNSFGKYNYRSTEDILEGLKPFISELKVAVTVNDEIVQIGERFYVKATATLICSETNEKIQNEAYAREEESKKGMDASQVTGATSSYARKYALNGLFAIDDTKDADSGDNSDKGKTQSSTPNKPKKDTPKPTQEDPLKVAKSKIDSIARSKVKEKPDEVRKAVSDVLGHTDYRKIETLEQANKIKTNLEKL